MPPSRYLRLVVVPIAVGDDLARRRGLDLARCRAASTRPRGRAAEASTITRGSWRRARSTASSRPAEVLDPGDPDARAEARGLDPERRAEAGAALAPALLADRGELDLGNAAVGEEPLQRQLVHADRRGEDVGADVGQVEPLEQPLGAAVLAERAVQGGEGDVGAEQAVARAQLDRPAVAEPAALAGDGHPQRLMARLLEAAGDGLPGAQRDIVLGGTAAGDDGDPHSSNSSSAAAPAAPCRRRR